MGAPQHRGKINVTEAASALMERQGRWSKGGKKGEVMERRAAGQGWNCGVNKSVSVKENGWRG